MIEAHYVAHSGDDLLVVNAARVSFAKRSGWADDLDSKLSQRDEKLIRYLASNGHWTPFAHPQITLHIKAPIFVARQCFKHKVGFVENEVSRRYVDEEPEFFRPEMWRKRHPNAKQGSSDEATPLPMLAGKCQRCGTELIYTSAPGQLAAHKAQKKFCSPLCQRRAWGTANPFAQKFTRWRATATSNGVAFDITEDDLDWPTHCSYLGVELDYGDGNARASNTASLDKIVPNLGYIPGNVQIISLRANKMKSDASHEELLTFAKNAALMHGGVFIEGANSYEGYLEAVTATYRRMIEIGVAPELARLILPSSLFTEWFWTGSLAAWARFCRQRDASDAQQETGDVARACARIVEPLYPVSWAALTSQQ